MPAGKRDGKKLKFSDTRKTQVINNGNGEMHELEDNWRQVGPLALDYDWTGWTELTTIEEIANMETDTPVTRGVPPPQSAALKIAAT